MTRIGLIGLGQRGMATLRRYAVIEGARITAVSDLSADAVAQARSLLASQGYADVETYQGVGRWQELCRSPRVDVVMVCTDWASHTPMAVHAMRQGKHVALEVPAAMTVRECWELVETAEKTGQRCTMLENCCYDNFHLGIMGLARRGAFGDIVHAEGAYIHDLRADHGWMSYTVGDHPGNPYPTHGLGPVCQLLDIGGSDRLVSLVSMSGGNKVNNSLLRTERGRTILLQFDERTPRPYSRMQTLCGTRGYAQKYPLPTLQLEGEPALLGTEAEREVSLYRPAEMETLIAEGRRLGVENTMNYAMDRRLVDALNAGQPWDISVYDAALWSCITELSALSALQGGQPVEIPDFTRGRKDMPQT